LYGLAGSSGKGDNFVENMLNKAASGGQITVVDDQVLTPSYTVDVAEAVANLIPTERYGTTAVRGNLREVGVSS
jgi:dTDP-4-dehydrorhamnose reductase